MALESQANIVFYQANAIRQCQVATTTAMCFVNYKRTPNILLFLGQIAEGYTFLYRLSYTPYVSHMMYKSQILSSTTSIGTPIVNQAIYAHICAYSLHIVICIGLYIHTYIYAYSYAQGYRGWQSLERYEFLVVSPRRRTRHPHVCWQGCH